VEERAASLVYHAGALGDFITTLPAIHAWRRIHVRDRIVLLGVPVLGSLALPGVFDEVWDAGARSFASLFSAGAVEEQCAAGMRGFRSALLFAASSSPLERHLSALGVPLVVRQEPFPTGRTPIVDYHLTAVPGLDPDPDERQPRVRTRDVSAPQVSPPTAALHAGSGSRAKNWPVERFLRVAGALREAGWRVAWIQGPAETGHPLPEGSTVWNGLSLTALAGALASCGLYVGNDSGVTHLAAAVGCPTIALFGPSDHRVWAPRGRIVKIVVSADGRMEGIAERDVLREVRSLLGG
jgi:heptosyltransferase III